MVTPSTSFPTPSQVSGRQRRLLYEWQKLDGLASRRTDISYRVLRSDAAGLPVAYAVCYRLRSICGIERMKQLGEPGVSNPPVFADCFQMRIDLPPGYPCIDAQPVFRFLTHDETGKPIPHPWHPNIRYFGDFAGRVCINMPDTYTELAWAVERVRAYLCYQRYHAVCEPPYPEDMQVAAWVIRQGEPQGWVCFDQDTKE